ncbi:MAG: LemA family protein [Eubacteriales bacterium]|nr:LemA family protein [Eubacteriales bacterium]
MKSKSLKVVLIILAIVAIIIIYFVNINNSLVKRHEDVYQKKSEIQNMLQRRADLIPNLVDTIKGYTNYEGSTLENIVLARSGLTNAIQSGDVTEMANANNELTKSINIVVEAYPDLKASQNFIGLQDELAGTENRIATARTYYNESVQEYNTYIKIFPQVFFSNMLGYESEKYFEANEEATTVPKVNFN